MMTSDLLNLVEPSSVFDKDRAAASAKPKPLATDSTVHRAMAVERARGKTVPELAEDFCMPVDAVEQLTNTAWFANLVLKMQAGQNMSFEERLDALGDVALEKQARILMTSRDDKLVASVSEQLLNRAKGKAVQNIQLKSLNINLSKDLSEIEESIQKTNARIAELTKYHGKGAS